MIPKVLNFIDLFPGRKTNTGAGIALLGYILTFLGLSPVYVIPIKLLAGALIAFGLAMKGLRGTPLMVQPPTK